MSRFENLEIDDLAPAAPAAEVPTPSPAPVAPRYTMQLPSPPMRTPQGVQMSARASRVYTYLNSRGCRLTTFSTDQTVQGLKTRIEEVRNMLMQSGIGAALLGKSLSKLVERITVLRKKVSMVTTRGAMLEVD